VRGSVWRETRPRPNDGLSRGTLGVHPGLTFPKAGLTNPGYCADILIARHAAATDATAYVGFVSRGWQHGKDGFMAIQQWSENITVVELSDDPLLTEELASVMQSYEDQPTHLVLNFATVGFINSSNISKLLRLRKLTGQHHKRLILSNVHTQVWGVFMVTGLDKIFEFTNDIATALASLQLDIPRKAK